MNFRLIKSKSIDSLDDANEKDEDNLRIENSKHTDYDFMLRYDIY